MTITAQHYSDEQLLELPPDNEHLASCATCTAALTHIRQLAATLVDEIVWDDEPLPDTPRVSTVATLRSIATQMDAEDADAERYVAELLATPREEWLVLLAARPHYRTPGLVRRLIVETDRLIDSKPADVVEITAIAVDVADGLDVGSWYGDTVPRLRGAAWRERAYALYVVGDHQKALAAAKIAEDVLASCEIADFDRARLFLVQSVILRLLERPQTARELAAEAGRIFTSYGDEARRNIATNAEAMLAYASRDFRRAATLFEGVAAQFDQLRDNRNRATVLQNMASCYRELGDFDSALRYFGEAVTLFSNLGMQLEQVRARWHVGRVLMLEAKYLDAVPVFRSVKDAYERLNVRDKAALVTLDLAEVSLIAGRTADVVDLCRTAMTFYASSGLTYTNNAMTALGLLREAASEGELEPSTVSKVRTYLERLPQQPTLLFAQLPE
jgi:tetratricopeptide (TPR) repeat protein